MCLHPSVANSSHRDVFAAELVNALKSMHISGIHKDQNSPCTCTYPDTTCLLQIHVFLALDLFHIFQMKITCGDLTRSNNVNAV